MTKLLQVIAFFTLLNSVGFSANRVDHQSALLPVECMQNAKLYPSREHALTVWPKDSVIVEVGVFEGDFSKKILNVTAPSALYLVDINLRPFKMENIVNYEDITHFKEGDSSTLLSIFEDGFFDVIYIDGDHRLAGCRKDAYAAISKLKTGGLLVFNDYTHWDQFACPPTGMPYGVPAVVHEMLLNPDFKLTIDYLALQRSGFYDMALRKN